MQNSILKIMKTSLYTIKLEIFDSYAIKILFMQLLSIYKPKKS